jgi:hypothetical protein
MNHMIYMLPLPHPVNPVTDRRLPGRLQRTVRPSLVVVASDRSNGVAVATPSCGDQDCPAANHDRALPPPGFV